MKSYNLKLNMTIVLATFLLAQGCVLALPFCKKQKAPIINPVQKIEYVNICWWDNFNDPILKEYIIKAIENNHDARKASYQVEEYKQMMKYQFGYELPTFSVGFTDAGVHIPDSLAKDFNKNIVAVPFIASYEADIFLKNHDKTKASKKTYEASKFQEKSVYISLAADVATTYLNIVKFDELILLQQDFIKTQGELLRREQSRLNRGLTTATTVNNMQKDLETAKSSLNEDIKTRDKLLTQLAVLTGDSAENIQCFKRTALKNINYKSPVPKEISSDVIFARPDILAAESNLEKAKIDVRVARKEFLPSIRITGIYSMSNLASANFFSWQSAIAAIAGSVTQDIFKGGQKVANLKMKKAEYERVFEDYKQTDLIAIKEVKDSLQIIDNDTQVDENTIKKTKLQLDNFNRTCDKAKRGVVPMQNILTDKEQLLIAVQNKVNTKTARLVDYITLYKAVGGNL